MIQLNHVYKTFFKGKDTEVHALDDVTMTVKDGDFVTITGPSGSGKSTLMRVIEGMECADQGNCILNGIDLAKSSDKKRAEIKALMREWDQKYDSRIYNILMSMTRVAPSHLMDKSIYDFKALIPDALKDKSVEEL